MTDAIKLHYMPRACFQETHRLASLRSTRAIHIGAHRRAGKTVSASALVAMNALARKSDNAFIAPSLSQAMNIGWHNVLDILRDIPGVTTKRGEALIEVPNTAGSTSTIRFFAGADDGGASGVRGYGFDLVVIDEVAQIGGRVFTDAILPTLSGRENTLLVTIGTFRGTDLMYRLHEDADASRGEYSIILPASKTKLIPQDELLALARRMGGCDSPAFQREYEANRYVAEDQSFFDQQCVREAQARTLPQAAMRELINTFQIMIGVDVALRADKSVIIVRCGPAVLEYRSLDQPTTRELAIAILEMTRRHNADGLYIDSGAAGQAVIDICRDMGLFPIGVGFGDRASQPDKYANRRAEILDRTREWTERPNTVLPPGEDILREITVVRYEVNANNRLVIEPKKSIRQRLGNNASTDFLDALACTFATKMPNYKLDDILNAPRPHPRVDKNTGDELLERAADGSKYTSARRYALHRNAWRQNAEFDPHTHRGEVFDPYGDDHPYT